METVFIYSAAFQMTDGTCRSATVSVDGGIEMNVVTTGTGGDRQRVELEAALQALTQAPAASRVTIFTSNRAAAHAFRLNQVSDWRSRGWRKRNGSAIANHDLYEMLIHASRSKFVKWVHFNRQDHPARMSQCEALATQMTRRSTGRSSAYRRVYF